MTTAGQLTERIAFDAPVSQSDGYGGTVEGFAEQFTVSARLQYRNSGEEVLAARLSGTQTVILTVRRSSQTKQITTGWQCRDARSGTVYNIREVRFPPQDRGWVEVLAQSGVAT